MLIAFGQNVLINRFWCSNLSIFSLALGKEFHKHSIQSALSRWKVTISCQDWVAYVAISIELALDYRGIWCWIMILSPIHRSLRNNLIFFSIHSIQLTITKFPSKPHSIPIDIHSPCPASVITWNVELNLSVDQYRLLIQLSDRSIWEMRKSLPQDWWLIRFQDSLICVPTDMTLILITSWSDCSQYSLLILMGENFNGLIS